MGEWRYAIPFGPKFGLGGFFSLTRSVDPRILVLDEAELQSAPGERG